KRRPRYDTGDREFASSISGHDRTAFEAETGRGYVQGSEKEMKRILLPLILMMLVSASCAQSKRLVRKCSGSSNEYARVEVSRYGDIEIKPCPNRSLTINGVAQPKRYVALVSQSGGSDPVATVLENTLGATITWTRVSAGVYNATASSAVFTANKTAY